VPKRDAAASDKDRPVTLLLSLVQLYEKKRRGETFPPEERGRGRGHYTVFLLGCCEKLEVGSINRIPGHDSRKSLSRRPMTKVGNGHTIVWQVKKYSALLDFGRACFRQARALLSSRRISDRRGS